MAKPKSLKKEFPATEWKGEAGGVHQAGIAIARTQAEWKELWDAVHSNYSPAPKAPKLPKGKMAVAIFAGQTNKPQDLSITAVEESADKVAVKWTAVSRDSMLCVMFDPYIVRLIDATNKKIEFEKVAAPKTTPTIDLKSLGKMDPKP